MVQGSAAGGFPGEYGVPSQGSAAPTPGAVPLPGSVALPHPTHAGDDAETPWLEPLPTGDNGHKGEFGEQFVQALAIAADLNVSKSRDRLGVDWELTRPGFGGARRFPRISAQVKCWDRPTDTGEDAWRYPLRVHNFNLLAGSDFYEPRFLFLVVVPPDANDWIEAGHEGLTLRHAAYWACFHDMPQLDRPKNSSYTVSVPKANLLTVETLHSLFGPQFRALLEAS